MRYWKATMNGYILSIGSGGSGDGGITKEEYDQIANALHDRPPKKDGYGCRLREDLMWEYYELTNAVVEEDPTISNAKAFAVLIGEEE